MRLERRIYTRESLQGGIDKNVHRVVDNFERWGMGKNVLNNKITHTQEQKKSKVKYADKVYMYDYEYNDLKSEILSEHYIIQLCSGFTNMNFAFKEDSDYGDYITMIKWDNFAKIYTIVKYLKNVKVRWLSKLSNIPNTISLQIFEPSDNTLLIKDMSKGIRQWEMIYNTAKDVLVRKRELREIDDGQDILDKAEIKGDTVGYMTIIYL